ncbi:MAG: hypothetical protein ABIL22_07960 [candidate division WOR-3 bacterium]
MVQRDAWTGLKTQLLNDSSLSAYVKKFKWSSREEVFTLENFPLLIVYPIRTEDDIYRGVPKYKNVNLIISVNAKVFIQDENSMFSEILKFDEMVKNAIEKNIQLSSNCTIANIGPSEFRLLDKEVVESQFTVIITTKRFTAGNR